MDGLPADVIFGADYPYFSLDPGEGVRTEDGAADVVLGLHGGTLRWSAAPSGETSDRARRHLAEERALGLAEHDVYADFRARVTFAQRELRRLLTDLGDQGATIAPYGAAAKGATVLNASGVGRDLVEFVVDRNGHQQGKAMPSEVIREQAAYTAAGGRVIV